MNIYLSWYLHEMRIRLPCIWDYSKKQEKQKCQGRARTCKQPHTKPNLKPGNEEGKTPEIQTSESSMCLRILSLDNTYVTARSPPLAH